MAHTLTIKELAALALNEVKKGNGNKKILISSDDEGNEYHELFFSFTPTKEIFGGQYAPHPPFGVTQEELLNQYVVLG